MKSGARARVRRRGLSGLLAGALALGLTAPHASTTTQALAPTTPAAASHPISLDETAASAKAKVTGKPQLIDSMTTATREVTANPNGSYTLDVSPVPVRVAHGGSWVPVDAALHVNANGTISPIAVPDPLVLSNGGNGPLATMTANGQQMSVTLPIALPKPTLSGDTATYHNVLPDMDLEVTTTNQGGFSDVFVVKTPTAAHNPELATLLNEHLTGSRGMSMRTDAAGDLFAQNSTGQSVFTASAATAWDSATAAPTAKAAAAVAAAKKTPTTSTAGQPGAFAHRSSLHPTLRNNTLTLSAPEMLLNGAPAAFPIFIDPDFGPAVANFATVSDGFPNQPYINGQGTQGAMQVGYNGKLEGCDPCFDARSFVTLSLAGLPSAAQNIKAEVNFWDAWSASCTPEELDLWTTSPISTSSQNPTTWNNQPGWLSQIGQGQSRAYGWAPQDGESPCPANGIGWDISSAVATVVSAHGPTLTLGLRIPVAQEGTGSSPNDDNWKQLNGNVPGQSETNASITYDLRPNTPSHLYTSPATNCSSSNPTILGDTGITLYAPVSTPTEANLTTTFTLYKTSDSSQTNLLTSGNGITSDRYSGASGTPAVMVLPETFIKTQAGTSQTSFSWYAQTTDGNGLSSGKSTACTFAIDMSRPGAPGVTPDANPPANTFTCPLVPDPTTIEVGKTCAFTVTRPNGATISGYTYQVNQQQPIQVNATGTTTIKFNLPRIVNTLTVSALSAGGNIGSSTTVWFDGTNLDPPESDGDLTDDGTPDLIIPGGTTGDFPPGLWLAQGQPNGSVQQYPVNVGTNGLGINDTASDWNGSEATSGDFCLYDTQDVFAYFPGAASDSNPDGGGGAIVCGTGTNKPLVQPANGMQYTYEPDSFSYVTGDGSSYNASVIANGGTFTSADNTTNPYQLFYGVVPTGGSNGVLNEFAGTEPGSVVNVPGYESPETPDGDMLWGDWTITTAQDTRGVNTYTDMFLWNSSEGELYLWAGVKPNDTSLDTATGLSYTPYQIATNWNTGKTLTLRAADINNDGSPSLWATDTSTGVTTAYLLPATLTASPTLATRPSSMTTADHSWQFTDMPANASGSAISSTADGDDTLNLTGTASGADWNTGDLFSPDVRFTGSNGDLSTPAGASTPPINLTQSFTVSFWTKPETNGSMALSESGSNYPGLMIYPTPSGWDFYLANDNGTVKWGGDAIVGGNVDFGVWTHIQATYNSTTDVMSLYVDDVFVADGSHTPPSNSAGGPLLLGTNIDDRNLTSWYTGEIADVETWSGTALAPTQPASPASYHQAITPERILDTRASATNAFSGIVENGAPIGAGNTVTVPIVGDTVSPYPTGTAGLPFVPASATAVAVDVTLTNESSNGNLIAYADGTQRPITSSTNYAANTNTTGYQIVPLGEDGAINLYNSSTGTTQILVDITGYFTSNAALHGDQTYTPLPTAARLLDTRNTTANTNLKSSGPVPANSSFTVNIDGANGIAGNATAVAINLTATGESGDGYLEVYPTGQAPAADTSLTYTGSQIASLSADVPVGSNGTITIDNVSSATNIIGDISGYYTTSTTGQVYHTVNPTRLVDTRNGIGNTTGSPTAAVPAQTPYPLADADTSQITTATEPTLALMLTVTQPAQIGDAVAYPTSASTPPGTSNINWSANQTIANMALAQTDSGGNISILNQSSGTTQLIVDCSGYFASY